MKAFSRVLFLTIAFVLFFSGVVHALEMNYILDDGYKIPIPLAYKPVKVIDYLGEDVGFLSGAEDLFIDNNENLYVVDTKNNRILKMTTDGMVLNVFAGSEEQKFKEPMGIFVDDDGDMYIADTGNRRIVHLSAEGEYVEEFTKPDSEMLHSDFIFDPTKVCITPTGYIYVIKSQAFLSMDSNNRFRGYVGATEVGFDLWRLFIRIFATEEQKSRIAKKLPASYSNFTIDDRGMIYATVINVDKAQIRKITSVGKNIFKTDVSFGKGAVVDGKYVDPYFVDIAVDKNGIISALDQATGKIYQYDQEGDILAVFGGLGNQIGSFSNPSSLAVDKKGYIYVLDQKADNIQVFEPTNFINKVHEAVTLYNNGSYEESRSIWESVLKIDGNYELAHRGIAKALLKEGKWKESMEEYKLAQDKAGYSEAFKEYRHWIVREYFGFVVLAIAVIIWISYTLIKHGRKLSQRGMEKPVASNGKMTMSIPEFAMTLLFHPIEAFSYMKAQRGKMKPIYMYILFIAIVGVRVASIFITHFPLAQIQPRNASIWLECVRMLLPLITLGVAFYAITTISSGEALIGETLMAVTMCMLPYIILTVPLALLSRFMGLDQQGLYNSLQNIIWAWVAVMVFISIKTMNDYTFGKCVGVCALSITFMFLIWAVCILLFALTSQLFDFAHDVILEVRMLFL